MTAISSPPDRRIRRLRLRAESQEAVRHAAVLVEDALRTASLTPVAGEEWLLIRHLPLGRIARQATGPGLSLQLEQAIRTARREAVGYRSSAAGSALAVVVPDLVAALTLLARRLVRDDPTDEWFWSRLIPGWGSGLSRPAQWNALLESAHALPGSPVAVGVIANAVLRAGGTNDLLDAIDDSHATQWLDQLGMETAGKATVAVACRTRWNNQGSGITRVPRDRRDTRVRMVWWLTVMAIHEQPARAANRHLAAEAKAWLEAMIRPRSPLDPGNDPLSGTTSRQRSRPIEAGDPGLPADGACPDYAPARNEMNRGPGLSDDALDASGGVHRGADVDLVDDAPMAETPGLPEGRWVSSSSAGLFLVVPVLNRLGFAGWLFRHPKLLETNFPIRLLALIGLRTGLAPDDPLAVVLREMSGDDIAADTTSWLGNISRVESASLSGGMDQHGLELPDQIRELLAHGTPRGVPTSPSLLWLTALRRWCRRNARLGLASLVRRPGHMTVSRTHLDIRFPLASVDLCVRRQALDVDPGWVPWLGRVIRFHYLDDESNA